MMKSRSEKITEIIQHINRVEANCNILAKKLEESDPELALNLIKLGRIHDASKFDKFEFDHLHSDDPLFVEALREHHKNNPHHPEHWKNGIQAMPKLYIAEMVCDCKARGEEFGTSTRLWFHTHATNKYNFKMEDECGKHIEHFLNLLMKTPFSELGIIYKSTPQ